MMIQWWKCQNMYQRWCSSSIGLANDQF